MELPWRCTTCQHETMVDMENLESWPLDQIVSARGFRCENCGMMEAVDYTTFSLEEQMRKLTRYQPGHPKFKFLFSKVLRKAEGVQERGEALYGEIGHQNLVGPGQMG